VENPCRLTTVHILRSIRPGQWTLSINYCSLRRVDFEPRKSRRFLPTNGLDRCIDHLFRHRSCSIVESSLDVTLVRTHRRRIVRVIRYSGYASSLRVHSVHASPRRNRRRVVFGIVYIRTTTRTKTSTRQRTFSRAARFFPSHNKTICRRRREYTLAFYSCLV